MADTFCVLFHYYAGLCIFRIHKAQNAVIKNNIIKRNIGLHIQNRISTKSGEQNHEWNFLFKYPGTYLHKYNLTNRIYNSNTYILNLCKYVPEN